MESHGEDSPDGEQDEEGETEDMDERAQNEDGPHLQEENWKERFSHEEEPNDPELEELNKRLEEVSQSGSLEEMKNLHRELHVRHVMARQNTMRRIANLI